MVQSEKTGNYHMSWFTNGDLHQGIYYGRFSFESAKPENVHRVDGSPGAGHPFLEEYEGTLYLVWKGFDGQQSLLQLIHSKDDGQTWSAPETLITTSEGSDHPLIVSNQEGLYLSWKSDEHGYVFQNFTSAGGVNSSD